MEILWYDIRYGCRRLLKDRSFTVIVVLIMAVAIGANAAIFSVLNAVLFRPFPYEDSERLVIPLKRTQEGDENKISFKNFTFLREQNRAFADMAAGRGRSFYITKIDSPREVRAQAVSSSLFPLLGVQPFLGRGFLPEEEQPGRGHVVVLSYAFWQNYLGGRPDVLGQTLSLDREDYIHHIDGDETFSTEMYSIVGVMPQAFEFPFGRSTPFWVPLGLERYPVDMWARLKRGVGLDQARAEMAVLWSQLKQKNPAAQKGTTLTVATLLDRVLQDNRQIIVMLQIVVGFVLLIACSNVINLFLVRATSRQHEISTRMALGAARMRIIRQMLTESLLLSTGAGLLGLLMTFWFVKGIIGLCPADVPRLEETRIDGPVLAFTLGISLVTGIVLGALPAWKASGSCISEALKEQATRCMSRHGWRRLQDVFAVVQVAVSLILLIGAALLIRSLIALQRVDLGFRPETVLAMHIDLPMAKYPTGDNCRAFYEPLIAQVRTLPGVQSAALISPELGLGKGGRYNTSSFAIENRADVMEQRVSKLMEVSSSFFETMGIELIKGSLFADNSQYPGSMYLIIDENLANKHFDQMDPIGERVFVGRAEYALPITGVVSTVKDFDDIAALRGTIYRLPKPFYYTSMDVLIKTEGDPMRLAPALRAQVAALENDEVITRIDTLESMLDKMLAPQRFTMVLLALFAGTALHLASVGVYGLLQYSATLQVHEIGIRMALGASQENILKRVLGQGFKIASTGIGVGLAGTLGVTQVLSSLLYGVTPTDPLTLGFVSLVLMITILLASYFPARRASGIDPINVLRQE